MSQISIQAIHFFFEKLLNVQTQIQAHKAKKNKRTGSSIRDTRVLGSQRRI